MSKTFLLSFLTVALNLNRNDADAQSVSKSIPNDLEDAKGKLRRCKSAIHKGQMFLHFPSTLRPYRLSEYHWSTVMRIHWRLLCHHQHLYTGLHVAVIGTFPVSLSLSLCKWPKWRLIACRTSASLPSKKCTETSSFSNICASSCCLESHSGVILRVSVMKYTHFMPGTHSTFYGPIIVSDDDMTLNSVETSLWVKNK